MTTYYLNGTPLVEGVDITLGGFTYPYSWLDTTSASIRASFGIEKQGDINYDSKYYWNAQTPKSLEDVQEVDLQGNPLFVQVWDPEAINEGSDIVGAMVDSDKRLITIGLKTTCLREIKQTTNALLAPTDFYIIRNNIEALEIPESVSTYRSEVIAESTRLQNAILEVVTVEELIEVMTTTNFPKSE